MNLEPAVNTVAPYPTGPSTAWTSQRRHHKPDHRMIGRTSREIGARAIEPQGSFLVIEPQRGVNYAERLEVLMDWEGVVEEVHGDYFTARLLNRRGSSKVDTEQAEIPFAEVPLDDRSLVQPGAIFYLTVFRSTSRMGQSRRATTLYFRRLPSWTRAMIASADERAKRWKKNFGVGEDVGTAK